MMYLVSISAFILYLLVLLFFDIFIVRLLTVHNREDAFLGLFFAKGMSGIIGLSVVPEGISVLIMMGIALTVPTLVVLALYLAILASNKVSRK